MGKNRQVILAMAPGGMTMGCMCKKWLKLLGGLGLILVSMKYLPLDPWLVLGAMFFLIGVCGLFICKDDCCMTGKKK